MFRIVGPESHDRFDRLAVAHVAKEADVSSSPEQREQVDEPSAEARLVEAAHEELSGSGYRCRSRA
jgi:hypothetical protein